MVLRENPDVVIGISFEHTEDAVAYAELKGRLAEKYRYERSRYTDGKACFIARILEKAMSELGQREDE